MLLLRQYLVGLLCVALRYHLQRQQEPRISSQHCQFTWNCIRGKYISIHCFPVQSEQGFRAGFQGSQRWGSMQTVLLARLAKYHAFEGKHVLVLA